MRKGAGTYYSNLFLELSKVIGDTDIIAWQCVQKSYIGIAPNTVKKFITGSRKDDKEEVAAYTSGLFS